MIRLLARGEGSIALAQLTGACEMLLGAIAGSGTWR